MPMTPSCRYGVETLVANAVMHETVKGMNPGVISKHGRLSLIVRVNVVLSRTAVVDSDWRFDNLYGSHLQSQSELYHVSWWYYTLVIDLIGQLRRDVIGRLSVKPWCYWLWRFVMSVGALLETLPNRTMTHRVYVRLKVSNLSNLTWKDPITVCDAILASRQTCEKLQCLYEQNINCKLKLQSKGLS